MRALLFSLPCLLLATAALADDESQKLEACRSYGDMAFQVFAHRDKGDSEQQQLALWQQIPENDPSRTLYLSRAGAILNYAYGPAGQKLDPKTARTAFFRGCRQASNSDITTPAPARDVKPLVVPYAPPPSSAPAAGSSSPE